MAEKRKMGASRGSGRRVLVLILVLGVVAVLYAGGELDPLLANVQDEILLLTNSRLPDTSPRLQFSLTAPRNPKFAFDERDTSLDVNWVASSWQPNVPNDASLAYEIMVQNSGTRIGSFTSAEPRIALESLSGYLGQVVKFTVHAVGTIRIGEHEYEFHSDNGAFALNVPAATPTPTNTPTFTPTPTDTPTPTNTPTATATNTLTPTPTDTPTFTPTNTPTATPTPTDTPTNTPTSTPTRLSSDDTRLAFQISLPRALRFVHNPHNDSGTISWIRSNWVPENPADSSDFKYEVRITYPHRTFGPYVVSANRYTFANLDSKRYPLLNFSVTAVGSVRIGHHAYEFSSEVAEFEWTRPDVTITPDFSELNVLFPIVVNGVVNVRSCADTSCDPPLGRTRRGQVFEVFGQETGEDGVWYRIVFEGQIGYIAGWLPSVEPLLPTVKPSYTPSFTPTSTATRKPTGTVVPQPTRVPTLRPTRQYVPNYDAWLDRGKSWDDRLPGWCDIRISYSRGSTYALSVLYEGKTYEWYRVTIIDPAGKTLRASRAGKNQRYENADIVEGTYVAETRELNPSRRKSFGFMLNSPGTYILRLGGSGC